VCVFVGFCLCMALAPVRLFPFSINIMIHSSPACSIKKYVWSREEDEQDRNRVLSYCATGHTSLCQKKTSQTRDHLNHRRFRARLL